jgi:tetratricopeptide (TPR) repeat protein
LRGVAHESYWGGDLKAIESYSKSIEKDSMNYWAYANRSALYIKNDNKALAFDDCTRMIEINPTIKDGFKSRGILYMQDQQFIRAYWDFTKAIVNDTTDSDLFFNRGGAAFYANYYDEAIKDFNQVLRKKPKDGETYYMLSNIYLQKQDTLLSIAMLDSASRFKKYEEEYHKELYKRAKEQGLKESMERALDRLVLYYGYHDYNYLERGKYHYQEGNFEKALKDLKVYVKRKKDDGEGFYFLGQTQLAMGDLKAGNKSIDRARKLGFK